MIVDVEVTYHDLFILPPRVETRRLFLFLLKPVAEQSLVMGRIGALPAGPGEFLVRGDGLLALQDSDLLAPQFNLNSLAGEVPRNLVTVGAEGDHAVSGNLAGQGGFQPVGRHGRDLDQPLFGEPLRGAAAGGSMNAGVGDFEDPLLQFPVQVLEVDEAAPRKEVAFDVLHAGLDLALGLGPVGPAKPWIETEVTGEVGELCVEGEHAGRVVGNNGLWIVIEQF